MSQEETPPPVQQPEGVQTRKMLIIGAVALAIFIAATVGQWLLIRLWEKRTPTAPREVGQVEIGMVDQAPFALETRASRLWRAQREQLHGYGWTDPEARLIHVPVDEAMKQLLTEEGAEGGR